MEDWSKCDSFESSIVCDILLYNVSHPSHRRTPGCAWTPDKESAAAELHLVLALMSTGPVGISDQIGMTNATLVKRTIRADGVLLKPSKAITAVDSTFLEGQRGGATSTASGSGYLYGTHGVGRSWIFLSFKAAVAASRTATMSISAIDFWPKLQPNTGSLLAFRHFDSGNPCTNNTNAVLSNCIVSFSSTELLSRDQMVFSVPPPEDQSEPGADLFVPKITYAWQNCIESRWFLLGELNKYVPLSPVRFQTMKCTKFGVYAKIVGVPGETVTVTALKPDESKGGDDYIVVVEKISIPETKVVQVVFGSSEVEGKKKFEVQ
jgi:hypothetical protein